MADYTPAYRRTLPFALDRLSGELDELRSIHGYATQHDDFLVLDELFCRVVALEHQVLRWDQQSGPQPRVQDSLRLLDRALKWGWLAREEEDHPTGMYADKLKEALAILEDLRLFLEGTLMHGMTEVQAEALAATIKERLPQAEVEIQEDTEQRAWVVEARNPRRGTSQRFRSPEEFDHLLQQAAKRSESETRTQE